MKSYGCKLFGPLRQRWDVDGKCLFAKFVTYFLFVAFTYNTELFAVQDYGCTPYCSVCVFGECL